jgi:hypothetical protein
MFTVYITNNLVLNMKVDADREDVGDEGEVDFKENSKFGSHMKEKGEAASEFSKSKSLAEQRQYLPIFSVREELLQVIFLSFFTTQPIAAVVGFISISP